MGGDTEQLNHNNKKKKINNNKINIKPPSCSSSFLTKGSQVEVSSDEEGFNGVWFVATVLRPPSISISTSSYSSFSSTSFSSSIKNTRKKKYHHNHKHTNLVYVEYHNLVSEDGSSDRLREYADLSFVRPAPPSDTNTSSLNFQLNDVVDAFYRDGWWTGVITTVVDSSNFVVTFPNPPDEIQFHISDLRVHREWVDGKWVQPENQRTAGLMFSVGKNVELSLENISPYFRDAWFPATVIKDSGNGQFVVEYQRSGINEEAEVHQITVDYHQIRPSPPHLRERKFVLLEKVDALYDFGWWSGVITKELADSRYVVFFKHSNKERELGHLDLRPHMEWKDGKWFSANQDTVCNNVNGSENAVLNGESSSIKGDIEGRTTHSLNLTEKPVKLTTPEVDRQSIFLKSMMKTTTQTSLDSNDKHSQRSKKSKDEIEADDQSLSNTGPNVGHSNEATSPTLGQSGVCSSEEAIISDQAFGKTENLSHGKKVRSKRGKGIEMNSPTIDSVRKKGRLAAELKSPKALPQGATGDSAKKTSPDVIEKEHAAKDLPLPVIIGLQCSGMTVSRGKILQHLPNSEQTPNGTKGEVQQSGIALATTTAVDMEGKQVVTAETITPKRKRGRPPKIRVNPEISVAVNQQNGDVAPGATAVVESTERNEVVSPVSEGTELPKMVPVPEKEELKLTGDHDNPKKNVSISVSKVPLSYKEKLPSRSSQRTSTARRKYTKGKRGKRRTISINTESSAQDSQNVPRVDGGLEKDLIPRNPEISAKKSLDAMSDDQPLSRWFEGMHSQATVDGAAVAPERTVVPSSESNERQLEIVVCPPVAVSGDIAGGDAHSLPFVRNTSLWQTIESMEAFRMIPQRPHFSPLNSEKEGTREGSAIGLMVNFSSVVEKTSRLRFDDPRSAIEDCLETLVELESHGFDVKIIRDRLTNLLFIKDKQEVLEERSKEIKAKMDEQNLEGVKIDEEIEEIDKQIRELQERRAQVLSRKVNKGSEISALEAAVDGINQGMTEARLEFDGLAAAPW